MRKMKLFIYFCMAIVLIFGFFGCNKDLSVENLTSPDTERAISVPKTVGSIVGGSFLNFWQGMNQYMPAWTLSTMGDEYTSSWGNAGMYLLASEPRVGFPNSPTYVDKDILELPWYLITSAISQASDGLTAVNNGLAVENADGDDITIGTQAYAKFIQGIASGYLACFFDRAFILDENVDLNTTILVPQPYADVMAAAKTKLEECITICETNTFDIPDTWISGVPLTNDQLAMLAHSYLARYMAAVARNPEERAAVDWAAVESHASKGVDFDFAPEGDGSYWYKEMVIAADDGWFRVDYKTIGPADTSGKYDTWLATPLAQRKEFVIDTPDLRIGTVDSAGTEFAYAGPSDFAADRGTYHFSMYYHTRWEAHYLSGFSGPMFELLPSENDLLMAEAKLRSGDAAGAATLIDVTRVGKGGLDPANAGNIGSPSDARKIDGSLWAQFKYEKGIELMGVCNGGAFFDRRGWGELVEGTPVHFPVPAKELILLDMDNYSFGGVGGDGSALAKLSKATFMPAMR